MNNLPMKQEKLNIFQKFRIRLYLMRKYSSSRFNDAPEYIKQDERVLKQMIKGEQSLSFYQNEKLIGLFKTNSSLFDAESKNKVVEYALENRKYDIILGLTEDEQYDIITSKNEDQIFKYLSLNVVKRLILEKKFDGSFKFSFGGKNDYEPTFLKWCNLEVQTDIISQNKEFIQFASDDVQISYLKTHEKDIELVNSVVKNKFFRENISFLANHLEYMEEADRETQLKLVIDNIENLRYLDIILQKEIIQKHPMAFEYASEKVKRIIFSSGTEKNKIAISVLNYNLKNLKYISYDRCIIEEYIASLTQNVNELDDKALKEIFIKSGTVYAMGNLRSNSSSYLRRNGVSKRRGYLFYRTIKDYTAT